LKGVLGWFLQRASGVVLVAGMAWHFYTMHFAGPEALSYDAVRARFDSPLWVVFNALFLVAVIYHGFGGLWGIALEYLRGTALNMARGLIIASAAGLAIAGFYILTL
jgi:succinate dehydrogenase hydrophobic membrane anchor protein